MGDFSSEAENETCLFAECGRLLFVNQQKLDHWMDDRRMDGWMDGWMEGGREGGKSPTGDFNKSQLGHTKLTQTSTDCCRKNKFGTSQRRLGDHNGERSHPSHPISSFPPLVVKDMAPSWALVLVLSFRGNCLPPPKKGPPIVTTPHPICLLPRAHQGLHFAK